MSDCRRETRATEGGGEGRGGLEFLMAEPGGDRRRGEGEVSLTAASRVGAQRGVVIGDCRPRQSQRIERSVQQ